MIVSSADIKRQILASAEKSDIKKRITALPRVSEGEQIEWGNDLEALTKTRGWALVESYMLRRMNLVGLALDDKPDSNQKGIAKGFIELMQWIQLTIQKKDEILAKEKEKYGSTEVLQEEEG